jgi:hypothetical protein
MTDIVNLGTERERREEATFEMEMADDEVRFEAAVERIIDALVASELPLNSLLTAACRAMIDLQEINGVSRAAAIKAITVKMRMFTLRGN